MKTIVIERCLQNPGFFSAGKTYHLVSTEKGLFIIHLGRWLSAYTNASAFAGMVLSGQDKKNNEIHETVLRQLAQQGPEKLVDNKNSFLITKQDIIEAELKNIEHRPSLKIKTAQCKMTLHFWLDENKENLKEIYERLK